MKTQSLLALSGTLLVGLLGGTLFTNLAGGQVTPSGLTLYGPAGLLGPTVNVTVSGIPTPQQMMRIVGGPGFTVPAGKLFVATGMGAAQPVAADQHVTVGIDGNFALGGWLTQLGAGGSIAQSDQIIQVPPGLVATAGQTVTVGDTTGQGVLLGYLVDA